MRQTTIPSLTTTKTTGSQVQKSLPRHISCPLDGPICRFYWASGSSGPHHIALAPLDSRNTAQKKQALEQQKIDAAKAAKKRKEAAEEAKKLAKELKALQKQKEEIDELETEDETEIKKPKYKRNDISMLDLAVIPSKKVELDGDAWKPPMRTKDGKKGTVAYDPPGAKWKEDSSRKLYLLFAMSRELKAQGLVPPPMTFATLMEFIEGRGGYTLEFSGRVFIYLIALILNQKM